MSSAALGAELDQLRAQILSDPALILDDKDVMRALVAASEREMGTNIVDLRGLAMERLEARLDRPGRNPSRGDRGRPMRTCRAPIKCTAPSCGCWTPRNSRIFSCAILVLTWPRYCAWMRSSWFWKARKPGLTRRWSGFPMCWSWSSRGFVDDYINLGHAPHHAASDLAPSRPPATTRIYGQRACRSAVGSVLAAGSRIAAHGGHVGHGIG